MGTNSRRFIHSTLFVLAIVFLSSASIAYGQNTSSASGQGQVAAVTTSPRNAVANQPVYTDYRGVKIGMSADEVRSKLDQIKKGDRQDVLVFSQSEAAQIYYDDQGKVSAISIDYFGDVSKAPTPDAVLGAPLQAKPDGSMYQLNRYPEAGYWVSYNRTAGDKPIITITVQKM
ncbi:MAG TPA: hypothetical protein VFO99_11490 [Pyrinomonadaceae bacterium]|nr:hypothetical protein [Pyrinomonadaceae bacterium]